VKFEYLSFSNSGLEDLGINDLFIEDRNPALYRVTEKDSKCLWAQAIGNGYIAGDVVFQMIVGPKIRFFGMNSAYGPHLSKVKLLMKPLLTYQVGDKVIVNNAGRGVITEICEGKFKIVMTPSAVMANQIKGKWTYIASASELKLAKDE
jgi:hypothetical protein